MKEYYVINDNIYKDAPKHLRLLAFLIDVMIVGVTCALYNLDYLTFCLLAPIYYIISTLVFGRTIGNFTCDLEVIDTDEKTKLGKEKLILREGLGRMALNLFPVMYLIQPKGINIIDKFLKTRIVENMHDENPIADLIENYNKRHNIEEIKQN